MQIAEGQWFAWNNSNIRVASSARTRQFADEPGPVSPSIAPRRTPVGFELLILSLNLSLGNVA
jgi:hypothetical protein